jgi:hypothetical protein
MTTHQPGPTPWYPGREPMQYSAPPQHGYTLGDPGNYPPTPPPPARKSHTLRTVLIVLAVLAALCGGAGVLFVGAVGGTAKVVTDEQASRAGDITVDSCRAELGTIVYVQYTIVNSGTTSQTYIPQFDLIGTDGTVLGQASDITSDLAPGKTYKGKAMGTLSDRVPAFTCKLVSA